MMSMKDLIKKEENLAKYRWSCQMCETGETFEHKFQLVTHWYEAHSVKDVTYETCQWCAELFVSTDSSAKVILSIFSVLFASFFIIILFSISLTLTMGQIFQRDD